MIAFFPYFTELVITDSQSCNENFCFFTSYGWSKIDYVGRNFLWSITTLQIASLMI